MFSQDWSHVLAASVAPVVVISASGLLCLAFYNRLAAIVSRLRTFQRERLQEAEQIARLAAGEIGDREKESLRRHRRVLENLGVQTVRVLARARLIRATLQCLLGTIAAAVASSIFNGIALFWPRAAVLAAVLFLIAMASMLAGIVAAMMELGGALDIVEMESELMSELATDAIEERDPDISASPR